MRRCVLTLIALLLLVAPARAQGQIGKSVMLAAGSPEDKALAQVSAETDPAKKLELLERWMAEHGKGDLAILGYELYLAHYTAEKNYDKAFEAGEKLLELDPDGFSTAVNLYRLAMEKPDVQRQVGYGERVAGIVERYKGRPAPEGVDAAEWGRTKADVVAGLADTIGYVQYTLYTTSFQTQDAGQRAALLERFLVAFPKSPYATNTKVMIADAYQQSRAPQKMVAFAQKVLAGEPENFWMMITLADYWATQKEQLEQAEAHATKALEVLGKTAKVEGLSDEEWVKQKGLQQGLAWSALGQVHLHKTRDAQAVEALKAASTLLKPYDYYYGRNLYFLGFVLARMKKVAEARPILIEATTVNSPYKALAQETLGKIGGPGKAPGKKRP